MSTRDERSAREEFAERYAVPVTTVADEIERRVIGGVWGANGYTTLAQADELARRLQLDDRTRLLDVGTGRGWPGLYFAWRYGCTVVGTDMPVDALGAAQRRATALGVTGRFRAVAAAGGDQPFGPSSFDAVVHTDVLC